MDRFFPRVGAGDFDDVTAVILAGGQSSRMASFRTASKAFLRVGDETVIEREIRALESVFKDILVISNEPGPYLDLGLKAIPDSDRFPGIKGPIIGIFSGLQHIPGRFAFVVACDMPFISPELVEWMGKDRGLYDVVVPRKGGYLEPLFGYYGKSALPYITEAMENGVSSVQHIFPRMNVKVVEESDIKLFDPEFDSFINLNTPEDLARAESIIGGPVKSMKGMTSIPGGF